MEDKVEKKKRGPKPKEKKKVGPSRKPGRPFFTGVRDKKISAKEVIKLFQLGISEKDICDMLLIQDCELQALIDSNPYVYQAKRGGILKTNLRVVEALLKSATGYSTEEVKTERRYGEDSVGDWKRVTSKMVTTTTKEFAPSYQAMKLWLDNKSGDWKNLIDKAEKDFNISIFVDGKDIKIVENNNNKV